MSGLSRRHFLATTVGVAGAAAIASPRRVLAQTTSAPVLRVQFTTGGHTVPVAAYEMFDDPLFRDLDTWMVPFPHPFNKINDAGGPDVIALMSYITAGYPDEDRAYIQKYLDAGKGLVVLHHAVGENQTWPWWYQDVMGGALIQREIPEMPRSGLRQFPKQMISPTMDHPITRDVKPFILPPDELFYNMWLSPKAKVLFKSDDPAMATPNNGAIGWLGTHPKARVVCFQCGHTDQVNSDPRYRHVIHNMILWAGKKLS
jgi:type 1 glutamine amidotransferase